ncbi:MAG: hypothetical protein ACW99U_17045 [Candidatus Thorarchaeota archaeon]|jgi:hypothetical protein
MEYKNLVDVSNLVIAVLQGAMGRMGLSSDLILAQVKDHMGTEEVQDILSGYGLKIDGSDVKSITDSWVEVVKKIGAAQRVIVENSDESQVVVDLGECAFGPATKLIRGDDKEAIPPCPFIAMLTAALEVNAGKTANVERCEWKPELNTSVFTIGLE